MRRAQHPLHLGTVAGSLPHRKITTCSKKAGNTLEERTQAAMVTQRETPKTQEVAPYTIELSSHLNDHNPFCPMETTFARVEPHGAVVLFRFVSGEEAERFELSGAEVDALLGANRRRRATIERYQASRNAHGIPRGGAV